MKYISKRLQAKTKFGGAFAKTVPSQKTRDLRCSNDPFLLIVADLKFVAILFPTSLRRLPFMPKQTNKHDIDENIVPLATISLSAANKPSFIGVRPLARSPALERNINVKGK